VQFDELTHTSGEWLRGTGPQSDIVISSRIRLARNLAQFPFGSRADRREKAEIEELVEHTIAELDRWRFQYIQVGALDELDCQLLVERQLISRELAEGEGPRGLAFVPEENVSIMVNEEDHLRLQVMRSGLVLDEVWAELDALDDAVEQHASYAFHEQFGYLTACPTNVGTGMRVSVMMHLPALAITNQMEKVFRALSKIHLAVRGVYGEGSQPMGDFYQISNQLTLGKSEQEIIRNVGAVVPNIIDYERQAREALVKEKRQWLHDKVSRAYGILGTAQTISSEETMHLLSSVRMGVNLGLLDDVEIPVVNELFIHTQPAHLQKLRGTPLESSERNIERAKYLRRRLRELGHRNGD
jgi:protein arginine kinase